LYAACTYSNALRPNQSLTLLSDLKLLVPTGALENNKVVFFDLGVVISNQTGLSRCCTVAFVPHNP
jgi:hypothetical protein